MFEKLFAQFRTPTKPPLVVIVGPTASGKTSMAVELAQKLETQGQHAEVISADSRQIYREIPIFSAAASVREQEGVPHHFVGSERVSENFTAGWFAREAGRYVDELHARGAIPIVAGGSGFWIQGLITQQAYPEVPQNPTLRAELAEYSNSQLVARLRSLDADRASSIDPHNTRRLVRAIEIAEALGTVPERALALTDEWDIYVVYLKYPREDTRSRIATGVRARYRRGLLEEAASVYKLVGPERFRELGLAYKYCEAYWEGEMSEEELIEKTITEERRYAKRQRTFFDKMMTQISPKRLWVLAHPDDRTAQVSLLARVMDRYRSTLHSISKTEA